MMPPVRATGSPFAAAVNSTVPLPCPDRPAVMLSHGSLTSAVHEHSRSAFTGIAPPPPPAGRGAAGVSNVTAHLVIVEGDVDVVPDAPHPTRAIVATTGGMLCRNRRKIEPG